MNLLIVEDEDSSRESLVAILGRHRPDLTVHSASNGEEALAKIELIHYDVVLADIQMPRMDGLSMMEKIRQFSPDTQVIMISAYDYFYYAQRALQLGACDYILKPFDEQRILSVLDKALLACRPRESAADFFSDPSPANAREFAAAYLQDANWGRVVLLKESPVPGELPRSADEWQELADRAGRYLSTATAGMAGRQFWVFVKRDLSCLILLLTCQEKAQDRVESSIEHISHLAANLQQERRPRLFLSVGTLDRIDSIQLSQLHAEESARYLFYNQEIGVLWFPTLSIEFACPTALAGLGELIRTGGDPEQINSMLEKSFREAALACVMPKVYRETMDRWIDGLARESRGYLMTVDLVRINELRGRLLSQEQGSVYLRMTGELLCEISRLIGAFNSNKNAVLLEKCVEYIEKNYANPDLSLQTITEHFYFNPSYFSTIFKKQTGKTIMQYLTMVRINHAKELLRNLDIRVNEVAVRVGFSDMRYFMRVFKGETGVTPGTYRKRENRRFWN